MFSSGREADSNLGFCGDPWRWFLRCLFISQELLSSKGEFVASRSHLRVPFFSMLLLIISAALALLLANSVPLCDHQRGPWTSCWRHLPVLGSRYVSSCLVYTVLELESRTSCVLGKHSPSKATFSPPRALSSWCVTTWHIPILWLIFVPCLCLPVVSLPLTYHC